MTVPEVSGCLTLTLPDHWAASDRVLEAIEYPNPAWTFQRGHFGTQPPTPPPPLPEPPPSRFARCDGDTIRVWYFESSAKHHLNISGDQATAIFGGTWWGRIGSMSASDCARWPTGSAYGVNDARRIAR